MKDKLAKLMEKKKDEKELDPTHKAAKMSMLKALRDEMAGMMKDDLTAPGMKKVEVAAPDKDSLAEGLDKAKDMLGADEESDMDESDDSMDLGKDGIPAHEEPAEGSAADIIEDQIEHEASEGDLSDEEIAQLEALLEKVKKSKMAKM